MSRAIALLAASKAVANVGTLEEGDNRGKAVEAYQASCKPPIPPGSPWCAAFVRFRMKSAATELGITYDATFPRSGYTPDWSAWGKKNSKWVSASDAKANPTKVRVGDCALFYFSQLGRIGHIGIVVEVHDWGVWTVEGNTSPEPSDDTCVERDGDGVFKKKRNWSELGQFGGFVLVDF